MEQTTDPIITTASGISVNLLKPHVGVIDIRDIAQSLGAQCRFTGHANGFYSVAEHSVECANLVLSLVPPVELEAMTDEQKRVLQLEALMHDAPEAYLGDVSRPLKSLLNSYKALERIWEPVIAEAFGLPVKRNPRVTRVDQIMNVTEYRHLMPANPSDDLKFSMATSYDDAIDDFVFRKLDHNEAANLFYDRFIELTVDPKIVKAAQKLRAVAIPQTDMKDLCNAAADEHLVRHMAADLIDETESVLRNYVQAVAGTPFLSEPDNTIKDSLVALLLGFGIRMENQAK
jgi:5'-deoxynucleotidase YfbR-like HD superfamily hydrolase